MHYTGTIWRPPYEVSSLLLEVTAGCTHHKCKFCTLYDDIPFKFRMSPLEDIESDLSEAQALHHDPVAAQITRLRGLPQTQPLRRVFLTGANPFVLSFERLMKISALIRKYIPSNETIGCFARITDIGLKTDEELAALRRAGYTGLTIGVETATPLPTSSPSADGWTKPTSGIRFSISWASLAKGVGSWAQNGRQASAISSTRT